MVEPTSLNREERLMAGWLQVVAGGCRQVVMARVVARVVVVEE